LLSQEVERNRQKPLAERHLVRRLPPGQDHKSP
jgi:hypothetical protein